MAKRESLATRLYRGDVSLDFIGKRRRWYIGSGIVILVSILSLAIRGLTPSIDFKGGAQFAVTSRTITVAQMQNAVSGLGIHDAIVQSIGTGSERQVRLQTPPISQIGQNNERDKIVSAISSHLHVPASNVSATTFGATWGSQITNKAILGLVIFLVFVVIYLAIRFEWKMALAAIVALLHDLVITAGIYSLSGFEVSPSTVIALLTILGYSLYDTVVVFDKVLENTQGIAGGSRMTFSEAANLAVNQTLVRSINTSIIALLPVIGLLVIGAGFLGAGSLKDLSFALLIGLAAGAYSSIFIATPLVCELKEREPAYRQLAKRVAARRGKESAPARAPMPATVGAPLAADGADIAPA